MQPENLATLNAASLLKLADSIIEKHQEEGCESPLNPGLIARLNYKLEQAKAHHEESEKYKRLCDQAKNRRDRELGLAERYDSDQKLVVDYLQEIMKKLDEYKEAHFIS